MIMKWVITGTRTIQDQDIIYSHLEDILNKYGKPDVLIHGCCKGVDEISGNWAKDRFIPVLEFPAKWRELGKKAGPIRNREMADVCVRGDICVSLWDGVSKGTKDMIDVCESKGLVLEVKVIEKEEL